MDEKPSPPGGTTIRFDPYVRAGIMAFCAEDRRRLGDAVNMLVIEGLKARGLWPSYECPTRNVTNGYEWSIRPPDFDPDIWPTYIANETEARSKLANYKNWDLMRRPRTIAVGEWEIVNRREAPQKEDRGREVGA